MLVTIGDLYDALAAGCDQHIRAATVGGEQISMRLLNLFLRHIEERVAPVAEEKGIDVETMWVDTGDLPWSIRAMAMVAISEETMSKDFGNSTYADFKSAYYEAVDEQVEIFTVNSVEFYIKFAKYLIEYLDDENVDEKTLLNDIFVTRED